jgi:hypothetical protein
VTTVFEQALQEGEGTCTYNGRQYKLLYVGNTKFGRRAHLQFMDGGKDFRVDATRIKDEKTQMSAKELEFKTFGGAKGYYDTKKAVEKIRAVLDQDEELTHKEELIWDEFGQYNFVY